MDIEKFRVADLKAQLAAGDDVQELLAAMKEDSRVSVRKLAAAYMRQKIREEAERERVLQMYAQETAYYNQGLYHVAGIDEAGRGPAAGPVMVAAVILPPYWECPGLNDSKKSRQPSGTCSMIRSWPKPSPYPAWPSRKRNRRARHLPRYHAGHV